MKAGSLRTRTVVSVLATLAVLLLGLSLSVLAIFGARLHTQIEDRLTDRASAATALVGTVDNDDLAERLSAQGVAVKITSADGQSTVAGPSPDELRKKPGALPPADRHPTPVAQAPAVKSTAAATITSSTMQASDGVVTLISTLSDGSTLTLTAGTGSVDDTLAQLSWVMFGASAVFLVIAGLALVIVVRVSLRPLETMTVLARSIAQGDRGRRLRPARPGTEIGRVATAFDEMLDGIEGAETRALAAEGRIRDFVSDAAHELRTPIAGVQAAADTLVRAPGTRAERERLAVHVVREAGRASRLVDDMLTMASVDRGLELDLSEVDVCAIVAEEVERVRLRYPAVTVDAVSLEVPLVVQGDVERLRQVLANLLENAAKLADTVVVTAEPDGESVRVTVVDNGPGVGADDATRIFDRLVRLDTSRQSAGGAGLGLPIARGIARAHGGDVVCVPREPGGVFVVTMPRVYPVRALDRPIAHAYGEQR